MKISVIITVLLIGQVSASFLDVFHGAVQSVQNSFGKLLSDVVTDVKETVDCTILAVEHVLSLSNDATTRYYDKCGNVANKTDAVGDVRQDENSPKVELTLKFPDNEEYLQKLIPAEIDEKINETLAKVLGDYKGHDNVLSIENVLAKESEQLTGVSELVREELEKLSKEVNTDIKNIKQSDTGPSVDTILQEIKLLEKHEQNSRNASEAAEIHHVIDEVLGKLDAIEATEAYENLKLEEILKDLENNSNNTFSGLRQQFEEWKEEESRHLGEINKKIHDHEKVSDHLDHLQSFRNHRLNYTQPSKLNKHVNRKHVSPTLDSKETPGKNAVPVMEIYDESPKSSASGSYSSQNTFNDSMLNNTEIISNLDSFIESPLGSEIMQLFNSMAADESLSSPQSVQSNVTSEDSNDTMAITKLPFTDSTQIDVTIQPDLAMADLNNHEFSSLGRNEPINGNNVNKTVIVSNPLSAAISTVLVHNSESIENTTYSGKAESSNYTVNSDIGIASTANMNETNLTTSTLDPLNNFNGIKIVGTSVLENTSENATYTENMESITLARNTQILELTNTTTPFNVTESNNAIITSMSSSTNISLPTNETILPIESSTMVENTFKNTTRSENYVPPSTVATEIANTTAVFNSTENVEFITLATNNQIQELANTTATFNGTESSNIIVTSTSSSTNVSLLENETILLIKSNTPIAMIEKSSENTTLSETYVPLSTVAIEIANTAAVFNSSENTESTTSVINTKIQEFANTTATPNLSESITTILTSTSSTNVSLSMNETIQSIESSTPIAVVKSTSENATHSEIGEPSSMTTNELANTTAVFNGTDTYDTVLASKESSTINVSIPVIETTERNKSSSIFGNEDTSTPEIINGNNTNDTMITNTSLLTIESTSGNNTIVPVETTSVFSRDESTVTIVHDSDSNDTKLTSSSSLNIESVPTAVTIKFDGTTVTSILLSSNDTMMKISTLLVNETDQSELTKISFANEENSTVTAIDSKGIVTPILVLDETVQPTQNESIHSEAVASPVTVLNSTITTVALNENMMPVTTLPVNETTQSEKTQTNSNNDNNSVITTINSIRNLTNNSLPVSENFQSEETKTTTVNEQSSTVPTMRSNDNFLTNSSSPIIEASQPVDTKPTSGNEENSTISIVDSNDNMMTTITLPIHNTTLLNGNDENLTVTTINSMVNNNIKTNDSIPQNGNIQSEESKTTSGNDQNYTAIITVSNNKMEPLVTLPVNETTQSEETNANSGNNNNSTVTTISSNEDMMKNNSLPTSGILQSEATNTISSNVENSTVVIKVLSDNMRPATILPINETVQPEEIEKSSVDMITTTTSPVSETTRPEETKTTSANVENSTVSILDSNNNMTNTTSPVSDATQPGETRTTSGVVENSTVTILNSNENIVTNTTSPSEITQPEETQTTSGSAENSTVSILESNNNMLTKTTSPVIETTRPEENKTTYSNVENSTVSILDSNENMTNTTSPVNEATRPEETKTTSGNVENSTVTILNSNENIVTNTTSQSEITQPEETKTTPGSAENSTEIVTDIFSPVSKDIESAETKMTADNDENLTVIMMGSYGDVIVNSSLPLSDTAQPVKTGTTSGKNEDKITITIFPVNETAQPEETKINFDNEKNSNGSLVILDNNSNDTIEASTLAPIIGNFPVTENIQPNETRTDSNNEKSSTVNSVIIHEDELNDSSLPTETSTLVDSVQSAETTMTSDNQEKLTTISEIVTNNQLSDPITSTLTPIVSASASENIGSENTPTASDNEEVITLIANNPSDASSTAVDDDNSNAAITTTESILENRTVENKTEVETDEILPLTTNSPIVFDNNFDANAEITTAVPMTETTLISEIQSNDSTTIEIEHLMSTNQSESTTNEDANETTNSNADSVTQSIMTTNSAVETETVQIIESTTDSGQQDLYSTSTQSPINDIVTTTLTTTVATPTQTGTQEEITKASEIEQEMKNLPNKTLTEEEGATPPIKKGVFDDRSTTSTSVIRKSKLFPSNKTDIPDQKAYIENQQEDVFNSFDSIRQRVLNSESPFISGAEILKVADAPSEPVVEEAIIQSKAMDYLKMNYENPPYVPAPKHPIRPPHSINGEGVLTTHRPTRTPTPANNFRGPSKDYDSFFHLPQKDTEAHQRALQEARELIAKSKRTDRIINNILKNKNKFHARGIFNNPLQLNSGK